MDVLIPVFNNADNMVDQLRQWIDAVRKAEGFGLIYVATCDVEIAGLAERLGAVALVSVAADTRSKLLPKGAGVGLKQMVGESVLVIDPCKDALSPEELERAVCEFEQSGAKALISVGKLRDNPCQLEAYYSLVDTGLVHCFECSEKHLERLGLELDPATVNVTGLFPFDWSEQGVAADQAGKLFVRSFQDDRHVEYRKFYGCGEVLEDLWVYEDQQHARLIAPVRQEKSFSAAPGGYALAGKSVLQEGLQARIYRGPGISWAVVFEPWCLCSAVVVLPILKEGSGQPRELCLDQANAAYFDCPGEVSGFVYWLMSEIGDEAGYDLRLDFPGEGILWESDLRGRRKNLETGQPITGRQCFPDVFGPDGALAIVRLGEANGLEGVMASGEAYGFIRAEDLAFPGRVPMIS